MLRLSLVVLLALVLSASLAVADSDVPGQVVAAGEGGNARKAWQLTEDTWFPDFARDSRPSTIPRVSHAHSERLSVGVVDLAPRYSMAAMKLPHSDGFPGSKTEQLRLRVYADMCQRDAGVWEFALRVRPIMEDWSVEAATGEPALQRGNAVGRLVVLKGGSEADLWFEHRWLDIDITGLLEGIRNGAVYGLTVEPEDTYLDHASCLFYSAETEHPPELIGGSERGASYLPWAKP